MLKITIKSIYKKEVIKNMDFKKENKEDLKKRVGEQAYNVTQNSGTEMPFTGKHNDTKDKGIFKCVVCGQELFDSKTKFDSGSGWPSFYDAYKKDAVKLLPDGSHFTQRTEVRCNKCDAHLGHVFDDAIDQPTQKRFCINSGALDFKKDI